MNVSHRILVVCDDTATLERLGCHLGERGYEVQCAETVHDALRYAESWSPELAICDSRIGELRGLDVCEMLRNIQPRIRCILITPPGETPDYNRATGNRVVAFLGTPFNPEDLMHFVTGAFNTGDSQCNRREHSRHSLAIEAHLTLINPFDNSESRPIASLMRDVSRSGITMIVRQILPVPSMLRITFLLTGQQLSIPMLAKSMSCTLTQIPGVFRLGAKFIGLLPAELEKIFVKLNAANDSGGRKDIFMGKSFRDAALEWIERNQGDISGTGLVFTPRVMAEIADTLAESPSGEEYP